MNDGNFRCRLRDSARILATGEDKIKYRLEKALLDQFLLANMVENNDIPEYFQRKHKEIVAKCTAKNSDGIGKVKATLHGKHGKTLSKIASDIFDLHRQYEEYLMYGELPE